MVTPAPMFGLLGISAKSLVDTFLTAIAQWIDAGAASLVTDVGKALNETTSVSFGSAFLGLYGSMQTIGWALALPFLIAATIQAIIRQDAASLVRTVLVRAPLALLGSSVAIWLVEEALAITDAFSSALLTAQDRSAQFTTDLVSLLVGPSSPLSGSIGVTCALATAVAAFMLWIELVVRSSAVLCASLFVPLALAGVIWPVTSHWIRRLAETLAALILAKVAMCAVLVLGVTSVEHPSGVSGVIEGIAILLLSSLAPYALLRMLPFIEQGAASHLGGYTGRVARAGHALATNPERFLHPLGGGGEADLTPQRDPIPRMTTEPIDPVVFDRAYSEVLSEIDAYARRSGSVDGSGHS